MKKVYAVDLDGTLCQGEFRGEGEPIPMLDRIEKINKLYTEGNVILIYTARNPKWFVETYAWLIKHGVMHHGINMQHKPGADVYIDDKAINAEYYFDN